MTHETQMRWAERFAFIAIGIAIATLITYL